MNKTVLIPAALAAVLMTLGAAQAAPAASADLLMNGRSAHGVPVSGAAADKVVNVSEGGVLNIDCGQVVEFRDGGKAFAWKFDSAQHRAVNLVAIAPAGFASKNFTVHVGRNASEGN